MSIGPSGSQLGRYFSVNSKSAVEAPKAVANNSVSSVRFSGDTAPTAKKESIWKQIWSVITFPFRWFASLFKSNKTTDKQPDSSPTQASDNVSTSKSTGQTENTDVHSESSNPQDLQDPENGSNKDSSDSDGNKPDTEAGEKKGNIANKRHDEVRAQILKSHQQLTDHIQQANEIMENYCKTIKPSYLDATPELKLIHEMNERLRQLERPRQPFVPKPNKFTVGETIFPEESN